MFNEFSDLSKPITFDIEKNDNALALIIEEHTFFLDLADFYAELFDTADSFLMIGDDPKFSFGGPLLMDGE